MVGNRVEKRFHKQQWLKLTKHLSLQRISIRFCKSGGRGLDCENISCPTFPASCQILSGKVINFYLLVLGSKYLLVLDRYILDPYLKYIYNCVLIKLFILQSYCSNWFILLIPLTTLGRQQSKTLSTIDKH